MGGRECEHGVESAGVEAMGLLHSGEGGGAEVLEGVKEGLISKEVLACDCSGEFVIMIGGE